MQKQKKFAVFDIDGTLIRWQLFHAVMHELGTRGHISPDAHATIKAARMKWKVRSEKDSFRAYELVVVDAYHKLLKDISPAHYQAAADAVFEQYKDQTFVYTRNMLRELKQHGYSLFAISGSPNEVIQKLCAYYGFDDSISAKFVQKNGQFTGEIDTPVFDKKTALHELVTRNQVTFEDSLAVGDSEGDILMLEMTEHAVAFNPSQGLFDAAKSHGWRVVVERKNVIYELEAQDGHYVLA